MKKVIIKVLAISMLFSNMVMPTHAEESYPDYKPDTTSMPENIFMTDQGTNTSASRNFRAAAEKNPAATLTFVQDGEWVNAAKNYERQILSTSAAVSKDENYGYQGVLFKTTSSYLTSMEKFDPKKSYVISFDVKNNGDKDVNIGVAISNGTSQTVTYTKEYGYEGMKLTSEYQTFSASFKPAESFSPSETNVIAIGFPKGTEAGASVMFDTKDINALYIAEEIPYDMINVLVSDAYEVCQGGKFVMNAAVVNQVGTPGYLDKSLTWVAMDKAKTKEIEGFAFTPNSDGTTTVSVAETVEIGEYALVAISNTYEGYMKTAYINVNTKRITDSPLQGSDTPDNLILEPNGTSFYQTSNSSAIELENGTDMCTVKAITDILNENSMGLDGMKIRTTFNKGFASDFNFSAGKTYVVSAKVRRSEESTNEDVEFVVGLGQKTEDTLALSEKFELTDEWTEIATKITVPDDYDSESATKEFYLGMPDGTSAGSAFDIKLDVYIAEETLAGFSLETIGNDDKLGVDDTVTFNASISNQLGEAMSGYSQEFDWHILNDKRTAYTDDLTLDINKSKNKAKLNIDEFSKNGTYYVVAEQETNKGIIRQSVEVKVDVPALWEYVANLIENDDDERIKNNLSAYAKSLGITKMNGDDCNAEEVAKIIFNDVKEKIETEKELIKQLKRAMALSLFNNNPNNVSLDVESEMALEDIDKDGITIAKLFNEYLSDDGKKDLRDSLKNGSYEKFEDFIKPFAKEVILKTIEKPSVNGTTYIEHVLTQKNTELAGIDASQYISMDDKDDINSTLARNSYTAETLKNAIENYEEGDGEGEGASGYTPSVSEKPSTGGISFAPSIVDKKEEENAVMFKDVPESHWAYSDIYHLKQRRIVSGDENNYFNPDATLTREQFVKMLCEAFEYPQNSSETEFIDVDTNAWYARYVNAATKQKIVNGIDGNRFGVGLPITRQDLCVIVYRAMGETDDFSDELSFEDTDMISDYAKSAVAYLSTYDVVNGFGDNSFKPQNYCTKAQAAKILCKILNIKGVSE